MERKARGRPSGRLILISGGRQAAPEFDCRKACLMVVRQKRFSQKVHGSKPSKEDLKDSCVRIGLIGNVIVESASRGKAPGRAAFRRHGLSKMLNDYYSGDPGKAIEAAYRSGQMDFAAMRRV